MATRVVLTETVMERIGDVSLRVTVGEPAGAGQKPLGTVVVGSGTVVVGAVTDVREGAVMAEATAAPAARSTRTPTLTHGSGRKRGLTRTQCRGREKNNRDTRPPWHAPWGAA